MKNFLQENAGKLVTLFRREISQQMYSLTLSATRTAADQLATLSDCAAAFSKDAKLPTNAINKAQHSVSLLISILRPSAAIIEEFNALATK